MKIVRVGFYHHGAVPDEEDAKALAGINVSGRNADRFNPNELENFDAVVVDEGVNTATIKKSYGDIATSVAEFVAKTPAVPTEPERKADVDLDKPVAKPKAKPQGK